MTLLKLLRQFTSWSLFLVDKKERKDGRNPEEELKHYEFNEFKRP